MSLLAALTNAAHIGLATPFFDTVLPQSTQSGRLVIIFILEHVVLLTVLVLIIAIPPESEDVSRHRARDRFMLARQVERGWSKRTKTSTP